MPDTIALLDACVLYPAPLRDFFMQLTLADAFRARWTEEIHEEWMSNLLQNRPDLKRQKLEQTRDLMNQNVRDCLVTDYQDLIPTLVLPDPNDRHILAAAVVAQATVIVTFNRRDFPAAALEPYGLQTQHPDEFVMGVLSVSPELVFLAFQRQRQSLRNPSKSAAELLATLEQQGLAQTAASLQRFPDRL